MAVLEGMKEGEITGIHQAVAVFTIQGLMRGHIMHLLC